MSLYRSRVAVVLLAAGGLIGASSAQVASALLRDEDPLPGNPAQFVGSIGSMDTNGAGGWSVEINHDDNLGGTTISSAVGSADGVTPAAVLFSEGVFGLFTQTSWEFDVGLSDAGETAYGPSGNGGPDGGLESAWIDGTGFAIEGEAIVGGPFDGLFWSFASGVEMTDDGVVWWSGGVRSTFDGSTSARGLFNSDDVSDPVIFSGQLLSGLPAPVEGGATIDFDYKVSAQGTNYILQVEMETTGTGVSTTENNVMVISGQGLTLDGGLVREASTVPASVGGLVGESWDNFDYMGVNEFGDFLFTGDTDAATSEDEFVCVNGQIVLREGEMTTDGFVVSGAMENGDLNENGDWAVVWDIDDPVDGNIEALIVNGAVVLAELDEVDWDNDGAIDAGVVISASTGFSGIRSLRLGDRDPVSGDVTVYFTAETSDNGGSNEEGFYALTVATTPGAAGDVAINVTDSPDPLLSIPGSITYTVAVRNNSPAALTGVITTTTLDGGLAFNAGASDPIAVDGGGGTVTAMIGAMAPNEVVVFDVVADAAAAGSFTTTTTVAANEADSVPGNNSATNMTAGGASADLAITITDSPDPVTDLSGMITYTVTVDSIGPSDATGVTVDLTLDPTTTFNAPLSDPLAVDNGGGMISVALGSVPAFTSADFDIVVDVSTQTLVSIGGSVSGLESDPNPADNSTSEDTNVELFADLTVSISDAPDPLIPSGGDIVYTVTTTNNGPSDATGVATTLTLDGTTVFTTAAAPGIHDGSPAGGDVSAAIGSLASGASNVFTVTVNAPTAGRLAASAVVTGSANETDDDPGNNTGGANTLVLDNTDGFATGVYSNVSSLANADVPGVAGAKFGTGFDRLYISPDGGSYIFSADTDLASSTDEVVIVGNTADGTGTVVVQEGTTALDLGDLVGPIETKLSINDAGQYAFATNTDAATSSDEVIVKWDGSMFVTVAREGDFAPPTAALYSTTLASPNIINDGTVWFIADTDGLTDIDQFVLSDDGADAVLQEGVTLVGPALWDAFDTGDLSVDATGANFLVEGDDDGLTASDKIAAFNNTVVIRENEVLAGSGFSEGADAFSPTDYLQVTTTGNWWARGGNNDDQDWVLRNGAVLATTGGPIFAGATESFDDGSFASTFFLFAESSTGDFIIGGATDSGDSSADTVVVLNDERLIAREGDPIDLDNNGVFDDNAAIRSFGNDDAIITPDGVVYLVCTMRTGDDNGSNTDIGDAIIRIDTSADGCPCEFSGDPAMVDVQDLLAFLALWFVNDAGADLNGGGVDVTDLLDFLACWFPASTTGVCS